MQYLKAYEENPVVTKVTLKNGLTVLINEFKGVPVASITTFVKGGYADEPPELAGISAVLAHAIFGKTSTRAAGVMAKDIRALGGLSRSTAEMEFIRHEIVVPSGQWKRALELEADAVLNPVLDQDEVTHSIDVALRANREWLGPVDEFGRRMLAPREVLYAAAGIGRGASTEAIRGLGRERLLEYYKTCYAASRLLLVISGDVTSSEVLYEVVRLYMKAPQGSEKPARSPREAGAHAFRYAELRGNLDKPRIVFSYRTVPVGSADYPALQILRAVIGMGEGSALARRLRDQKKVSLGGATVQFSGLDSGQLAIQQEVDSKDLDRCEIATLTEIELIKHQEPDDGEMERARALLAREYWDALETVSGRARVIGSYELLGDWKKMNSYLSRVEQVKPADVVRVAEKYLRLENCTLTEYTPQSDEPRNLTSEKALSVFQQLLEPAADQELGEREKETVPAVNMPKDGAPFKPSEIKYSFKVSSILRGPELFIREDHTLPLVHIGFYFPGGAIQEKSGSEGVTALLLDTMLRGTKEIPSSQFYRQLEIYGGQIAPVVARDYFGYRLSVLSANAENALDLLAEIVTKPKLDDEDVGRQKQTILELVRHQKTSARLRAQQLLEAGIFKGHPYAAPVYGTEASVSSLNGAAVRDWYKALVEHKKPLVVIMGDTFGTSLAGFFVRNFSGSRFQEVKLPDAFAPALTARNKVQEEGTGDSSYVLLGFQAPPAGDEDFFPVDVLAHYLDGEGGALSEPVRAACGLDCDISVEYRSFERGGLIQAGVEVAPGGEEKVLKAVEDAIQKLPSAVITYRDFRSAVSQAAGRFNIEQQIRFAQIETVVRNILAGKGIDALQEEAQRLQEVKQDDLAEYGERMLKLEKSVSVRVQAKSPDSK